MDENLKEAVKLVLIFGKECMLHETLGSKHITNLNAKKKSRDIIN